MTYWYFYLKELFRNTEGQDMAEYSLLLGLIVLVVMVGAVTTGEGLEIVFDNVAHAFDSGSFTTDPLQTQF